MGRRRFRIFAGIWLAVLVGFIAAFPYLLYGIVKGSSCERVGGACGAVAALVGALLKPLVVLVVGIALLVIMWRRLRRLEIGRLWFAASVLWFVSSAGFLIAVGNFWGANFSMGMIGPVQPPVPLLFLLAFIGFLAIHKDDAAPSDGNVRIAWRVAAVAAGHGLLLSAVPVAFALGILPFVGMAILLVVPAMVLTRLASFGLPLSMTVWLLLADLAVFVAALAWILFGRRPVRDAIPA